MKMKNHFVAALIQAAKNDDIAEVRRLIADGSDMNSKDNKDWTALM